MLKLTPPPSLLQTHLSLKLIHRRSRLFDDDDACMHSIGSVESSHSRLPCLSYTNTRYVFKHTALVWSPIPSLLHWAMASLAYPQPRADRSQHILPSLLRWSKVLITTKSKTHAPESQLDFIQVFNPITSPSHYNRHERTQSPFQVVM